MEHLKPQELCWIYLEPQHHFIPYFRLAIQIEKRMTPA